MFNLSLFQTTIPSSLTFVPLRSPALVAAVMSVSDGYTQGSKPARFMSEKQRIIDMKPAFFVLPEPRWPWFWRQDARLARVNVCSRPLWGVGTASDRLHQLNDGDVVLRNREKYSPVRAAQSEKSDVRDGGRDASTGCVDTRDHAGRCARSK